MSFTVLFDTIYGSHITMLVNFLVLRVTVIIQILLHTHQHILRTY